MNGPRAIRVWHQSMTELGEDLSPYAERLRRHATRLFGDRVEVVIRGLAPGSYGGAAPSEVLGYPDLYATVLAQTVDAARAAERQGYDAFVIGSWSEPYLRETRSAVDLPVASIAESSLLVSCSLGGRSALIANAPSIARLVSDAVAKHHLGNRVIAVSSLEPARTEAELVSGDVPALISAFIAQAERAVDAGADTIIPAEAVLNEVLHDAGVVEIAGAPVVDGVGTVWHYAEMLVRLTESAGMRRSHRWEYPRAPRELADRVLG